MGLGTKIIIFQAFVCLLLILIGASIQSCEERLKFKIFLSSSILYCIANVFLVIGLYSKIIPM